MSQTKVVGFNDGVARLLGFIRVHAFGLVHAANVGNVKGPEINRRRVAQTSGKDGFDTGKQTVAELKICISDPDLSLLQF